MRPSLRSVILLTIAWMASPVAAGPPTGSTRLRPPDLVELVKRDLLREAMEAEGFIPTELEWWHYTWQDHDRYAELDIPFSELR